MVINFKRFVFYILVLFFFRVNAGAAQKILVERYEYWAHPVLTVFNKYGLTLYKVAYSKDGKCPTFYAKFEYSPDPRAPDAQSFEKIYFEILKANAFFPYALVDEEDDMRINVGWESRSQKIMKVGIAKALTGSTCLDGK